MLDKYIYGAVHRISPEAPVPIITKLRESETLGGAGNVARNAISLGARVCLLGGVANDNNGKKITKICKQAKIETHLLPLLKNTICKTRMVGNGQQLLRLDEECIGELSATDIQNIMEIVNLLIPKFQIVVLSDYAKGFLHPILIQNIIKCAHGHAKIVVVDPKGSDFSKYAGADFVTPNRSELSQAAKMPANSNDDIVSAGQQLIQNNQIGAILATRSEEGLSLITRANNVVHYHTNARSVYDVSGAGDTVVATLALGLGVGLPAYLSARLANCAGGVVVEKPGTSTATPNEITNLLESSIHHNPKLMTQAKLINQVKKWRQNNEKILFANGCFDLLHDGHIDLIKQARATAPNAKLIIGLNSDKSVRLLKGPTRPFNNQLLRADILGGLSEVSAICIFDDETPLNLVAAIRPDILIKGKDYEGREVVGSDHAGAVFLADLKPGFSSTAIINNIKP